MWDMEDDWEWMVIMLYLICRTGNMTGTRWQSCCILYVGQERLLGLDGNHVVYDMWDREDDWDWMAIILCLNMWDRKDVWDWMPIMLCLICGTWKMTGNGW